MPTDVPPSATPLPAPTNTPEPGPYPSRRGYHQLVFDTESGRGLLFSGQEKGDVVYRDLWSLATGAMLWQEISGAESPCVAHCPLAYDVRADRVIMYLGAIYDPSAESWLESTSETWAYDYNTDTWTDLAPETTPVGLLGPNMVYDVESDRMILFGGLDSESLLSGAGIVFASETWAYDFSANSWTNMEPEISPPGRNFSAMAYDAGADRVVLFGGSNEAGEGVVASQGYVVGGDTWLYDFNSNSWEEMSPAIAPPGREYGAMAYDPGLGQVVLFGGVNEISRDFFADTWTFDIGSGTWSEVTVENPPLARGWHSLAYDPETGKIILFGGGLNRDMFNNELWLFDSEAGTWTNATPDD